MPIAVNSKTPMEIQKFILNMLNGKVLFSKYCNGKGTEHRYRQKQDATLSDLAKEECLCEFLLAQAFFLGRVVRRTADDERMRYTRHCSTYRLTDPVGRKLVRLQNYITALLDPLFR